MENLVGVLVVHEDEHIAVAVAYDLFGLPEKSSLFHIENIVLRLELLISQVLFQSLACTGSLLAA